jgi:uncharacterized YkwD family protein
MKKPFKVLATSSLLLMLAACNNNDNAAYDALNPGEDVTNVSDHRGDNLGDAFRLRNGEDTAEQINTRNVGNRNNNAFDFNNNGDQGNRNNDTFDFNNDDNGDRGNRGFDTAGNQRNSGNGLAGNMNDTISADFTTINSGKYPHTRAIRIQEAKYGYVVVSPQGKKITVPDLQSITEQYARRFQTQIAQQGQPRQGGQAGQAGQAQQQQRATQQQQPTQQQPAQQQPTQQQPAQQQPTQQQQQTQQAPATPAKQAQQAPATQGISATEQKVIELTNAERRKAGLKDLVGDTKLSSVARTKSNDMQKNGYFSHTSPSYGSPFDMMRDFGVTYSTAGENIAQGQRTPDEVVQAWMNSEGHRKNILNGAFTHIGVGHDTTGNHWTQMFIGK